MVAAAAWLQQMQINQVALTIFGAAGHLSAPAGECIA
jgi:hypothetical protein